MKVILEELKTVAHAVVYPLFMLSLYGITKPLAYLCDILSSDEDVKFLDGEQ